MNHNELNPKWTTVTVAVNDAENIKGISFSLCNLAFQRRTFVLLKYFWNANTFNNLSSENVINWVHLIMAHVVILVLGLDSILQTLLSSFDKKVGLKARSHGLRVRMLSKDTVETVVSSVGE